MWSTEAQELRRPTGYEWPEYIHGPCKPSKAQISQTSVKTPKMVYVQPSSVFLKLILRDAPLKTVLQFSVL